MSTSKDKAVDAAQELRENAEQTRQALGDTVQELSDKFDVPARTKQAVHDGAEKAQRVAAQVTDQAVDQAKKTFDELPDPVRQGTRTAFDTVRQRPALVAVTLLGLFALWRLLLRRSR
jgi:ElaB/YqjD/DUF883 family membrane-anchored ribosome-binding protein